ncbi:MAG TPA: isoprenylcysteine carboxylmethyltransferase family protein [Cyanobacteria bacterium UBA8553]|nr:isoprenylcysteine carboxylmethyltransferase family protein [Cyanobacteria bacterium UBA8553]HAJ59658.1 isoprenylcysteine carboxylmethyltransferase family protein [Cyanobacteria bacterium UBA8543]
MLKTFLAYLLIACYFVIERFLRKGQQALSLQPGASDRGSSYVMWASGLFNILIVLLAPIFNTYHLGDWNNEYIGWIGLILMIGGLTLRYWAAKTMGEFYTRTLQILEGHQIVDRGLYSVIRHPGYLGVLLMSIGAGFAVTNWIAVLIITVTGLVSCAYRLRAEEEMLENSFGEEYKVYVEKTKRLVPFIY